MALFVIQQGLFVWTIWLWSRKGLITGADPGLFLGGGALVPCSTSTPINHIVFFLQNTSCIRKPQVILGGGGGWGGPCTLPLDPLLHKMLWGKETDDISD